MVLQVCFHDDPSTVKARALERPRGSYKVNGKVYSSWRTWLNQTLRVAQDLKDDAENKKKGTSLVRSMPMGMKAPDFIRHECIIPEFLNDKFVSYSDFFVVDEIFLDFSFVNVTATK